MVQMLQILAHPILTSLTAAAHFMCGPMSDLVICKFRKVMSLLRPDVIKQQKKQNSFLFCFCLFFCKIQMWSLVACGLLINMGVLLSSQKCIIIMCSSFSITINSIKIHTFLSQLLQSLDSNGQCEGREGGRETAWSHLGLSCAMNDIIPIW